jgi:hypothetical protein
MLLFCGEIAASLPLHPSFLGERHFSQHQAGGKFLFDKRKTFFEAEIQRGGRRRKKVK